jgi:hypothetical protein
MHKGVKSKSKAVVAFLIPLQFHPFSLLNYKRKSFNIFCLKSTGKKSFYLMK